MFNKKFMVFLIISCVFHSFLFFLNLKKSFALNEFNKLSLNFISESQNTKKPKNIIKKDKKYLKDFEKISKDEQINQTDSIKHNFSQESKQVSQLTTNDEYIEFDFGNLRGPKIYDFKPNYPLILKKMKKTGFVDLKVCVNFDGSICGVEIIYSSHNKFEESVLEALKSSRFEPAVLDGKKIKCWGKLRVRFELEDL
ncbi:MAG: energy transducer TonB [Endomicrobia bacterium]|nr:energy transducer TonB [Endomicrobiia bacterium]